MMVRPMAAFARARFFKTIKSELVLRTVFYTRVKVEQAIAHTIDGFYNPVRRHSALDDSRSAQFERTASC